MILNLDTIKFENKSEISTIIRVLEEWKSTHSENPTVEELINKLDGMLMYW